MSLWYYGVCPEGCVTPEARITWLKSGPYEVEKEVREHYIKEHMEWETEEELDELRKTAQVKLVGFLRFVRRDW